MYPVEFEFATGELTVIQLYAVIAIQIHMSNGFSTKLKNDFLSGYGNIAQNPFDSKVFTYSMISRFSVFNMIPVLGLKSTCRLLKTSVNFLA